MNIPPTQMPAVPHTDGTSSFEFVTYPNGQKASNKHKIYWSNPKQLEADVKAVLLVEARLGLLRKQVEAEVAKELEESQSGSVPDETEVSQ